MTPSKPIAGAIRSAWWLSFAIGAVAVAGGVLAFVISKNQPDLPSSAK